MSLALPTRRPVEQQETLPPEIYIPLVDSLFKDGRTLLAGTIFVTGSIFITYWKTNEPLLLACAFAVVLVAAARGMLVHA